MRRIETQRQMQAARRALARCYLCGAPLPSLELVGRRKLICGEHVIPIALLGPPTCPCPWPVVLDVHATCEALVKERRDGWISILHQLHTRPPDQWPDAGQVLATPVRFSVSTPPGESEPVPVIVGIQEIMKGVADWVRGLHAALYCRPLAAHDRVLVLPPVPAYNAASGTSIAEARELSAVTIGLVAANVTNGNADGIAAWCGQLRFWTVWCDFQGEQGPRWRAFWTITFPGVLEWSARVTSEVRPWHGVIWSDTLPEGAAVVDWGDQRVGQAIPRPNH